MSIEESVSKQHLEAQLCMSACRGNKIVQCAREIYHVKTSYLHFAQVTFVQVINQGSHLLFYSLSLSVDHDEHSIELLNIKL